MAELDQDHAAFIDALRQALAPWSLAPSPQQLDRMMAHYRLMLEANRTMNMTRITAPAEAAVKHYADSLALTMWARERCPGEPSVLDVGSGAGFPAVPVAIMDPTRPVTAVDGTRKKVAFLVEAASSLELPHFRAVHAHTAHWKTRQTFDVVCARAVASIARCLSWAARLIAPRGHFVAYKTIEAAERELAEARPAMTEHGFEIVRPFDYTLTAPGESLERRLVILRGVARQ